MGARLIVKMLHDRKAARMPGCKGARHCTLPNFPHFRKKIRTTKDSDIFHVDYSSLVPWQNFGHFELL